MTQILLFISCSTCHRLGIAVRIFTGSIWLKSRDPWPSISVKIMCVNYIIYWDNIIYSPLLLGAAERMYLYASALIVMRSCDVMNSAINITVVRSWAVKGTKYRLLYRSSFDFQYYKTYKIDKSTLTTLLRNRMANFI